MALSGSQIEELREALLSAFDEPSLTQMVRIGLEENLPVVAGGVTLREIVYHLITWSERTGHTEELVAAAVAANPGNPALKAFAAKYQGDGDEPPPPPPPDKPQPPSGPPGGASIGVYVAGNISTGGGDVVGGDKTVHGDEVRGDKVMGDQTKVGDISAHAAVAIGPGATIVQQVVSEADLRDRENLRVLRQMVTKYWIEGVLEKSLNHEAAIRLGLTDRSGMVENRPWRVIPQLGEDESRDLPPGTHIVDVFDQMNQRLLILGEPGSGKTTLLLELARELITRADRNPLLPSPVVFNLSSWSVRKPPLTEWLVAELRIRYNIPKKTAQVWIEQDRLLPLLDGLDEVASSCREDCAKSINQYRQDHLVPLVVCSRRAEYEQLDLKLMLGGAVLLQALTDIQAETFLEQAAPSLDALRLEMRKDGELRDLVKSPLILSMAALAYRDLTFRTIESVNGGQPWQQRLFDTFVSRMISLGKAESPYPPLQTLTWLRWLATRLQEHNQTWFFIEEMQPTWLGTRHRANNASYLMLLAGPIYVFLGGIILALVYGLIFSIAMVFANQIQSASTTTSVVGEMVTAPLVGILLGAIVSVPVSLILVGIIGLPYALVDAISGQYRTIAPNANEGMNRRRLRSIMYAGTFWAVLGLVIFGSAIGVTSGLMDGLLLGLLYGFLAGLAGTIVSSIKVIKLTNPFTGDSRISAGRIQFGLIQGFFVGLGYLLVSWVGGGQIGGAAGAVSGGILLWLVGGPIYGTLFEPNEQLEQEEIEHQEISVIPSQGIWKSARSSWKALLIVGFSCSVIFTLFFGLIFRLLFFDAVSMLAWPIYSGLLGTLFGLLFGLVSGLILGGGTVTKHCILRLGLRYRDYAPLNYSRFLDYAARLVFLRKIGGGYSFFHPLFGAHIADLTENDIERIAVLKVNDGGDT